VEQDAAGNDVFVIPVQPVLPSRLEPSWEPGPIANSRFTPEEKAQITAAAVPNGMVQAVEKFAPGWNVADCGSDMNPGLREEFGGKKNFLVTHPLDNQTGCVLTKQVDVPAGKRTALRLVVGHDPKGDWLLIVKAEGKELLSKPVSKETCTDGWLTVQVDLTALAGKSVKLELLNQPTGWSWEAGCWAEIAVETQ